MKRKRNPKKANRGYSLESNNLLSIQPSDPARYSKRSKRSALASSNKPSSSKLISIFSKKLSLQNKNSVLTQKKSNKKKSNTNTKKSTGTASTFIRTKANGPFTDNEIKRHMMFDEYLKAATTATQITGKKPLFFQKGVKLVPIGENEGKKKKKRQKIFVVSKAYKCIKQELVDRGWVENSNLKSDNFDLKFVVKYSHINFRGLKKKQIVNHFSKAPELLTTKVGLNRTLQKLQNFSNDNCDSFFPKCFSSQSDDDFLDFISYYKHLHAENILKNFINLALGGKRDSDGYKQIRDVKLETAIRVTRKRLASNFGEFVVTGDEMELGVCSSDWAVLANGDFDSMFVNLLKEPEKVVKYVKIRFTKEEKAEIKRRRKKSKKGSSKRKIDNSIKDFSKDIFTSKIESEKLDNLNAKEKEVRDLLLVLKSKFPQTGVNGNSNIWILKPAGLSRGRGIRLHSNIKGILNHLKSSEYSWVIQKYLENSLLYKNKKLDIRQWVLVTDFEPLTIWFYDECYVRVSSAEFNLSNLKDRYIHLTNNSVNKKASNFVKEEGFMSQDQMKEFLGQNYAGSMGEEVFEKIQKEMKRQVKKSLLCCQEDMISRKNSCSIYGYDFCIDEDLGVWLIEVNASPDFSFSSVNYLTNSSLECHREAGSTSQC